MTRNMQRCMRCTVASVGVDAAIRHLGKGWLVMSVMVHEGCWTNCRLLNLTYAIPLYL